MTEFILSIFYEFLVVNCFTLKGQCNNITTDSTDLNLLIFDIIFVCISTFLYSKKIGKYKILFLIHIIIFSSYKIHFIDKPLKHIITQIINIYCFYDLEYNTLKFFEYSLGRHLCRIFFLGFPYK